MRYVLCVDNLSEQSLVLVFYSVFFCTSFTGKILVPENSLNFLGCGYGGWSVWVVRYCWLKGGTVGERRGVAILL